MRLNKFCCCLSLGIGARFIGFSDFVSFLALAYQRDQWISSRNNLGDKLSDQFSFNFERVALQLFFLVCAVALMFHFPFKLIKFRFIPTGKYNRKAILPWLWLNQTILGLLYFIWISVMIDVLCNDKIKKSDAAFELSLSLFVLVLRSYMWFVVYSYFQELKENKIKAGALLDEKPQVNKKQEASKDEETKDYCALSPA